MNHLTVDNFSLKNSLECGQTFCWNRTGDGYLTTDVGQVVYVEQRGDEILYDTSDTDVAIAGMLGLSDPLSQIQREICKDDFMKKSIDFAPGLRIVRDPFFPCLVSFICSIRNNIPNIRRTVQEIRNRFGPEYVFRGKEYHGFPTPETLAKTPPEKLRELGLDWRADFIATTSKSIRSGEVNAEDLTKMDYEEAHTTLKTLRGVGDKVGDCVCLFSLGFLQAFPIDVWIERVIQKQYGIFTETGKSYAKKSASARTYFGKYAGYAQEYLYYYSRSTF